MSVNPANAKQRVEAESAQRLSPELAEFMHMLTALEGRFAEEPAAHAAN